MIPNSMHPYGMIPNPPEPKQVRVELVGTPTQINALLGKAQELGVEIVAQSGFRPVGGHVRKVK